MEQWKAQHRALNRAEKHGKALQMAARRQRQKRAFRSNATGSASAFLASTASLRGGGGGAPDHEGVTLRDADRVLVHQVVELAGDEPEVEVGHALDHAVRPDLLQRRHDGGHIGAGGQEALQ